MIGTVEDCGTAWVADSILRMPVDKNAARSMRSIVFAESVTKLGSDNYFGRRTFELGGKGSYHFSESSTMLA